MKLQIILIIIIIAIILFCFIRKSSVNGNMGMNGGVLSDIWRALGAGYLSVIALAVQDPYNTDRCMYLFKAGMNGSKNTMERWEDWKWCLDYVPELNGYHRSIKKLADDWNYKVEVKCRYGLALDFVGLREAFMHIKWFHNIYYEFLPEMRSQNGQLPAVLSMNVLSDPDSSDPAEIFNHFYTQGQPLDGCFGNRNPEAECVVVILRDYATFTDPELLQKFNNAANSMINALKDACNFKNNQIKDFVYKLPFGNQYIEACKKVLKGEYYSPNAPFSYFPNQATYHTHQFNPSMVAPYMTQQNMTSVNELPQSVMPPSMLQQNEVPLSMLPPNRLQQNMYNASLGMYPPPGLAPPPKNQYIPPQSYDFCPELPPQSRPVHLYNQVPNGSNFVNSSSQPVVTNAYFQPRQLTPDYTQQAFNNFTNIGTGSQQPFQFPPY